MDYVSVKEAKIPALGLGTWTLTGDVCKKLVAAALEGGWTHLDTAERYENEADVGAGIRAAGAARDSYFLTSKVWWENLEPDALLKAAERSLDRVGLEYFDLYLIHWPNPKIPLAESIAALQEVQSKGWARSIGVSNFPSKLVREAQKLANGALALNQVEYHPLLSQAPVKAACDEFDMAMTAYSPNARGAIADQQVIIDIGKRYGKSAVQVSLRWLVQQKNVVAIPRTSKVERLAENLAIFDFALTDEEMAAISALSSNKNRTINPAFAPEWDPA